MFIRMLGLSSIMDSCINGLHPTLRSNVSTGLDMLSMMIGPLELSSPFLKLCLFYSYKLCLIASFSLRSLSLCLSLSLSLSRSCSNLCQFYILKESIFLSTDYYLCPIFLFLLSPCFNFSLLNVSSLHFSFFFVSPKFCYLLCFSFFYHPSPRRM